MRLARGAAMKRIEVEAYDQAVNAWVIRPPGRRFPAVVIQGDSLHQLYALAQGVLDRARAQERRDPELIDEAEMLRDLLWQRMRQYEEVLHRHGFDLPYNRIAWPR